MTWRPIEHVPTGLAGIDAALGGGLERDAVHLLVGRPGFGKTQLACQIALNAAKADVSTGIISLELSRRRLGHLVAAQLSCLSRSAIAKGKLNAKDTDDCLVTDFTDNSRKHKLVTLLDLLGAPKATNADDGDVLDAVDADVRRAERRHQKSDFKAGIECHVWAKLEIQTTIWYDGVITFVGSARLEPPAGLWSPAWQQDSWRPAKDLR